MDVSCHRPFLPGTSLEPAVIPTAHASTFTLQHFLYYCDVPSIAVFCSESIECLPGTKFFLKLLIPIPVAPIITGTIVHFRFHVHCSSIHKFMYFNFFYASFCATFLSVGISSSISCCCYYYYYYCCCCYQQQQHHHHHPHHFLKLLWKQN